MSEQTRMKSGIMNAVMIVTIKAGRQARRTRQHAKRLEIKVVGTEPKKRKRGRPKKGTGTGATTKEKILKSKASIVRVTKSMKINQFKQSYHNGTFSQMPGNGMNFLRRYNLISNSSQIPRTSFHNVPEGTGLGKTKVFGPLMLPLGSSVKLYKYLTPKLDSNGRISQQFQKTHLLVAKHRSFPLAKFLSTRKGIDAVIEKLRNSPQPDKIRTFECRTKLMCEICYAKFVNLRYLAYIEWHVQSVVDCGRELSRQKDCVVRKLM